MARPVPPDRLERLAAGALDVFMERGYRGTRMADIARRLEVAPGTLYLSVESKDALFYLVVATLLGVPIDTSVLPLADRSASETIALLRNNRNRLFQRPVLDAALDRSAPADVAAEIETVTGELYDVLHGARHLMALLERSAQDLVELRDYYFREGRRRFLGQTARYVQRRVDEGAFRPLIDAALAARYINEAVTWFAWHRSFDPDSADIDDDTARRTCIDMARAALLP